jgi:hypothetical protein
MNGDRPILDSPAMTIVTVYALTMPPSPAFQREFERKVDADDYEAFWRKLGHCHVKRRKAG